MNKRKSLFRQLDAAISQLVRVVESEESGLVHDGRVDRQRGNLRSRGRGAGSVGTCD